MNDNDRVTIDFNQKNIREVEHLLLPETKQRLDEIRQRPMDSFTEDDLNLVAILIRDILEETDIKIEARAVPVVLNEHPNH
jgi:hypothetical protein